MWVWACGVVVVFFFCFFLGGGGGICLCMESALWTMTEGRSGSWGYWGGGGGGGGGKYVSND